MVWRLALVGDIMLQRPVVRSNAALALLREASLSFGNLEVPLSVRGYPAEKPIVFRADPSLITELSRMGVRAISFANNHSLDYGPEALLDTLAVARQSGLTVFGAGATLREALAPVMSVEDGTRIGWMAFACTLPAGFAATTDRPGVAPIRVRCSFLSSGGLSEEQPGTPPYVFTEALSEDLQGAQQVVRSARADCDLLIVSLHWGVPPGWSSAFQGPLADYQRPLAHALVEAGAGLIVGHHPHTLHGVEIYRGCPIFYSLGNFIFHTLSERPALNKPMAPFRQDRLRPPELRETGIFLIAYEGAARLQMEVIPCVLDEAGESQLADSAQGLAILRKFQVLCGELGTQLEIDGNRAVILEPK